MKKKCIVIYYKGAPVILADVKELEPSEFISLRNECAANYAAVLQEKELEKVELNDKIAHLENEIKILKGEED